MIHIRRVVIGAVLGALVSSPGVAMAQGRRHGMGPQDGRGHESGSLQQLEPVLQQMGGLMEHMAERIKAGPLTPDQTLQLSKMMEQLANMMTKLGGGMLGSDTATQLEGMRTRLTEMQKGFAGLMNAPLPAPQAHSSPQNRRRGSRSSCTDRQ
jgi:hypothetical protein